MFEKTLTYKTFRCETFASSRLNHVTLLQVGGGPFGTVPELLFEKKELIPALHQLLVSL